MAAFSENSLRRLRTCDTRLQNVMMTAIARMGLTGGGCTILCGRRGEAEQNEAYYAGKSKVKWPNSTHNPTPSMAVDAAPWDSMNRVPWYDRERLTLFAGLGSVLN